MGACSDDQVVIVKITIVLGNLYPIFFGFDQFNLRKDHFNPRGNKITFGLNDIVLAIDSKGDEQETRLVIMGFILINDCDLPFVAAENMS